jgi:hypothetical protein
MPRCTASRMTLLAVVLLTTPLSPLEASNPQAAIGLHITEAGSISPCGPLGLTRSNLETSSQFTSPPGGPYFHVYLLVCNGSTTSGVAGLDCGIDYLTGVSVFSWQLCATTELPSSGWPAAGGSNRISWDQGTSCQNSPSESGDLDSVIGVAGFFYLATYAATQMGVVPNGSGQARVEDCAGVWSDLYPSAYSKLSTVGWQQGGYNACSPFVIPTRTLTWSAVKSLLRG